jgi:hypothetical protein
MNLGARDLPHKKRRSERFHGGIFPSKSQPDRLLQNTDGSLFPHYYPSPFTLVSGLGVLMAGHHRPWLVGPHPLHLEILQWQQIDQHAEFPAPNPAASNNPSPAASAAPLTNSLNHLPAAAQQKKDVPYTRESGPAAPPCLEIPSSVS